MGKQFEIVREADVDSTPQEVFDAFTTGMAGWLWPSEFEPREGGKAAMGGTVTVWNPPHHFVTRMEGPDGWFNQLENKIEARDGGLTHYRYVHSGVFVEDWENQYDGADKHTDFYQHTFRQYLKHFSRRPAAFAEARGPDAAEAADAMDTLRAALGIDAGVAQDDTIKVTLPLVGSQEVVVDYLNPHFIGVRSGDAMYRFFGRNAFGDRVGLTVHLFGEGADAEQAGQAWQSWLNEVYA